MNVENNKSDVVVIVQEVNELIRKDSQAHRIERAVDRAALLLF